MITAILFVILLLLSPLILIAGVTFLLAAFYIYKNGWKKATEMMSPPDEPEEGGK